MMKRLVLGVVACMLLVSGAYAGDKVVLPGSLKAGESDLVLNGSGMRTKLMLDLYVAGLYVPSKTKDVATLLKKDDKMGMKLHIVSGMINSKNMSEATLEGFEKSTNGNIAPIKKEIDEMIQVFSSAISKNDVYDLVYEPGKGTSIYKNGKLSKVIPGEEFRKALFGIWIGQNPVQSNLKAKLAGS